MSAHRNGPHWLPVGPGQLALWHRPRLRAIPHLGCDRVATLLSEREGAREIGGAVQRAGIAWSWIPLRDGKTPTGSRGEEARRDLWELSAHLEAGESILLHCSAGMHRTGMMAYALLRGRGLSRDEALDLIERLRPHARTAMRAEYLAWGDGIRGNWAGLAQSPHSCGTESGP